MANSAKRLQLAGPFRGMASEASKACLKMSKFLRNRRGFALGASGMAVFILMGAIQRVRRRGRGAKGDITCARHGRNGRRYGCPVAEEREPFPCPILWGQIQQRDWLFELPPQLADSILARLDVQDLKALRATCRQTCLQVAARTTKLVRALDASPRTWHLPSSPRLSSIYPILRELHLIMAEGEGVNCSDGETKGHVYTGQAAVADDAGLGSNYGIHRRRCSVIASRSSRQLPLEDGCGGAEASLRGPRRCSPDCLRSFLSWSAHGQLHGLTLLDLSRCDQVPLDRETWAALLQALGSGDVTLRVSWRALLHQSTAGAGSSENNRRGGDGIGGGSNSATVAAATKARAKAKAAAMVASLLTSPLSPQGLGDATAATVASTMAFPFPSLLALTGAPPPLPRCTCSICGPCPPDVAPVLSALQVLMKLRPQCAIELAGRGLPVRSPAVLQQLCAVSQLSSVSLAVCGVRPLAHHAGWFSCLRRLHCLELRYREEPSGDVALHQIIRALQPPVPLRSFVVHRPSTHPLDEADLAALASLPCLKSLDAPGLRIHSPTRLALTGLTRLALRSDRLELTQPLVALFPALEHLELGHGAGDLPPTQLLAAAAAATVTSSTSGRINGLGHDVAPIRPLLEDELAPAAPIAEVGGGQELAEEPAGPQVQHQQMGASTQSLVLAELTLHLRLLQGLAGLQVLSIGGKPGHGVEALSSLTALSSLILVRCSEFRPLRKAVEELRGLTHLRSLELHACLGGDACGYEIARLLRRLQKLPNLARLVVHGCDPRLPQQLATAPLGRLAELQLMGLPELQPLDLRYVAQAQTALRRLVVRGCGRMERRMVESLPLAVQRPLLMVEWSP